MPAGFDNMYKMRRWIGENVLFLCTLALLVLIPLYPKLPLLDIQHTWVYIRVEDFVVAFVILIWICLLFSRKITLKTPLTFPIMLFWIIGGIATLHGVFFLFSGLEGVHANVAFLSYLRRIEYMSLFFVAYVSIRDKKNIYYVISILTVVMLLIVSYGFGQRFLGFPAFLTMNEEFAKGIPIQLSEFSRISSTFAGHYDLAAYLVLIIPIFTSMIFGFKNILIKIALLTTSVLGFVLLFMTVSRVSFIVLLLSLGIVLIFQKKRLVIISLCILILGLIIFSPRILQRFDSTVSEVEVLVDARTGIAVGPVKEVESSYFDNKTVIIQNHNQNEEAATISAILDPENIPLSAALVIEPNVAMGENLSQGTSYINLSLSPVKKKAVMYFFEKANHEQTMQANVYFGDFVIKKAKAYDLSFTTRLQGEWPKTIEAFKRNIFLGSGYGSVSLAVDNNYLRILGESGLLGLLSFLSIFIFAGIYIKKTMFHVDSPVLRAFVLGFVAGTFGLALNALLIDVFEASKIAFTYWLLMGITLGLLHLYSQETVDLLKECKKVISSPFAIVIYLFVIVIVLFSSIYTYYFVAADFIWLRLGSGYDTFYRPGTQLYFYFMNKVFWLNQITYHFVSILLYFSVAVLTFFIAKNIFKNNFLAMVSAGIFVVLSGHVEAILAISSIDILFSTFFVLSSLLAFIYWQQRKKVIYLVFSLLFAILSPFFHESGIVAPFIVILYDYVFGQKMFFDKKTQKNYLLMYSSSLFVYLIFRYIAYGQAFGSGYDFLQLPIHSITNSIGYILLAFLGPASVPIYQKLQNISNDVVGVITILIVFSVILVTGYHILAKKISGEERKIIVFGLAFFLCSIIPFLGMETIVPRYSYLPNVGLVIILSLLMKEIYYYLRRTNDKWAVIASVSIITIIFAMMHMFQQQEAQSTWRDVSEKSERFLISLNEHYMDEWKTGQWKFYFVNVPSKRGQAWENPASLRDAIWFVTQNSQVQIEQETLNKALSFADKSSNIRVFEFQQDGSVKEVIRRIVKGKPLIYRR